MGPVGEKTLRSGSEDTAMGDVTPVTPPRDTCRTAAAMQRTNCGVSQLWMFGRIRIKPKGGKQSDRVFEVSTYGKRNVDYRRG